MIIVINNDIELFDLRAWAEFHAPEHVFKWYESAHVGANQIDDKVLADGVEELFKDWESILEVDDEPFLSYIL